MDFLLVFALSLDTFFACIACGADDIRIPFRSSLVMAAVGSLCLSLSLLFRGLLESFFPVDWIRYVSFALLFIMGVAALFQAGIKGGPVPPGTEEGAADFHLLSCVLRPFRIRRRDEGGLGPFQDPLSS